MFRENDLKSIKESMTLYIAGVLLYPSVVYAVYIFYPSIQGVFDVNLTVTQFLRYILMVIPFFSLLLLYASWKLSSVSFGYAGEIFLRYFLRIFAFLYASLAVAVAVSAFEGKLEIGYFINNFKTIIWRLGSVFAMVYMVLIFFKMRQPEWGYISLGFMFVSLSQDIYFYLTKIENIVNHSVKNNIDKTLLLLTLIVFFGGVIVLIKLRIQAAKNLEKIKTRPKF